MSSLIFSCQPNPSSYISHIEGYWEIVSVAKNQEKIKEFKISASVDYFKINSDLSGYRKKVTPRFDGAFQISKDQSNFKLTIEANKLWIYYLNNEKSYREEIRRANKASLILANKDGFIFTYKPYEPLIFDEWASGITTNRKLMIYWNHL